MPIRVQNRTIWILTFIVFALIILILFRDGQFDRYFVDAKVFSKDSNPSNNEESFGDQVRDKSYESFHSIEGRKKFGRVINRLASCLGIQSVEASENPPLQIESVLQRFQIELGPASHQSDHWVQWGLRIPDGHERKLRLEVTESDSGKIVRELYYFSLTKEGQQSPLPIDPSKSANPTDEVINELLKEGEVFYKERAASLFFPGGERVEFVEKNGELSEINFFKESKNFHCQDVLSPETCQCL